MSRVGITGHQGLAPDTEKLVRDRLTMEVFQRTPICGVSSLAEGADQIFAEETLAKGGTLIAVIPCTGYEAAFLAPAALARYRQLRDQASEIVELDFEIPGEEAYWAAGKRVVELSEEMLAVWDGEKSGGLGGTADIVAFAEERGTPVLRIWPAGSKRRG